MFYRFSDVAYCSVLQCVTTLSGSVLQCAVFCCYMMHCATIFDSVLQCVAVCGSVLQCVVA